MLLKTQGIILSNVKYGDKKVISKIYTLNFGLQSYAINFGTSSKSKIKPAHLQPLNQVDLEIFAKEKNEVNRVNEIRVIVPYREINFHPIKNCIAGFMNEVLIKTLKESESNPELYYFVTGALKFLDETTSDYNSFHLYFMTELTKYLGFYPQNNFVEEEQTARFFNLVDGRFELSPPPHMNYLDKNDSLQFHQLLDNYKSYQISSRQFSSVDRNIQLNLLIHYYRFHVPGFTDFKSLRVLQSTLHG